MKILKPLFTLTSIYLIFQLVGCTYSQKEVVNTCDSTNVSYSKTIVPIINNNCVRCHATNVANNLGGGNILDNYTSIKNWTDTTSSFNLYTDVSTQPAGDRMPKGGPYLSSCDIAKIRIWLYEGAPNN